MLETQEELEKPKIIAQQTLWGTDYALVRLYDIEDGKNYTMFHREDKDPFGRPYWKEIPDDAMSTATIKEFLLRMKEDQQ